MRTLPSRALGPGATHPQAPEQAMRWIPVTSTGMTMVVSATGL
jgi:hypothetical protein